MPYPQMSINYLKKMRKLAIKMKADLGQKSFDKRPDLLGISSHRCRSISGDLTATFRNVKNLSGIKCDKLFTILLNMDNIW